MHRKFTVVGLKRRGGGHQEDR